MPVPRPAILFHLAVAAVTLCWSVPSDADTRCATTHGGLEARSVYPVTSEQLRAARSGGPRIGGFDIVLSAGPALLANGPALAAFERAAVQWESVFSDPITVTIVADMDTLPAGVIGQAGSVSLIESGGDDFIAQMKLDAALEVDDAIVASLPTAAGFSVLTPAGISLNGDMVSNKATLKAMGFVGLDGMFGAADASITFNSAFDFDYDSSNGVSVGQVDFETAAVHEIGHALGFTSAVDIVDFLLDTGSTPASVSAEPLDMFRFLFGGGNDPDNEPEFTAFARNFIPGANDAFDELASVHRLSTGAFTGDGNQASHWKDDSLTGINIGVMDPTLGSGVAFDVAASDARALDLMGYDAIIVPAVSECPEQPVALCRGGAVGKSKVQVKDSTDDGRDRFRWKLKKGQETLVSRFAYPLGVGAAHALCVYDESADPQPIHEFEVPVASLCGEDPCWKASGKRGYSYKDKAGTFGGLTKIKLRAGSDGRTQVQVGAKGTAISPPPPPYTNPLTVQYLVFDGLSVQCWGTTFSAPTKNEDDHYKAKGP